MPEQQFDMTQETYDSLKEQLDELIKVRRPEIVERIKEARGHGDLSENAEYDAAREEQRSNEGKIAELEYQIKNANIIEAPKSNIEVGINSVVNVFDISVEAQFVAKVKNELNDDVKSELTDSYVSRVLADVASEAKHSAKDELDVTLRDVESVKSESGKEKSTRAEIIGRIEKAIDVRVEEIKKDKIEGIRKEIVDEIIDEVAADVEIEAITGVKPPQPITENDFGVGTDADAEDDVKREKMTVADAETWVQKTVIRRLEKNLKVRMRAEVEKSEKTKLSERLKEEKLPEAVRNEEEENGGPYTITSVTDCNVMENKISMQSPVGAALMGHRVGKKVSVPCPDGSSYVLRILGIKIISVITVVDKDTGEEKREYTVTSAENYDGMNSKVPEGSALADALVGHGVGDKVSVPSVRDKAGKRPKEKTDMGSVDETSGDNAAPAEDALADVSKPKVKGKNKGKTCTIEIKSVK